jgi:hypothetical protein
MTLPTFTPTNASVQTSASNRLTLAGDVSSNVGLAFRSVVAAVGRAVFIRVAYWAALRRLEAGVEGNLFDEPVLWAEIKSMAWAEAGEVAGATEGPASSYRRLRVRSKFPSGDLRRSSLDTVTGKRPSTRCFTSASRTSIDRSRS